MELHANLDSTAYCQFGQGPDLLFLHGWGVEASAYQILLQDLSSRYRVTAPNLPGFGGTPEPAEPWGVEEYGAWIRDFCAWLKITPVVGIGHSNGGRLLLSLQESTDPFPLRKIVLFHSAGIRSPRTLKTKLKIFCYKFGKVALSPFPALRKRFIARSGSEDYRNASPLMKQTMTRLLSWDASHKLGTITASTLVVAGAADTAIPLQGQNLLVSKIPDAGLVTLNGGHWAFLQEWGTTKAVLESYLKGDE